MVGFASATDPPPSQRLEIPQLIFSIIVIIKITCPNLEQNGQAVQKLWPKQCQMCHYRFNNNCKQVIYLFNELYLFNANTFSRNTCQGINYNYDVYICQCQLKQQLFNAYIIFDICILYVLNIKPQNGHFVFLGRPTDPVSQKGLTQNRPSST